MAHVVIIGGGFAGVWSAAGAALARKDADLRITLDRAERAPGAAAAPVRARAGPGQGGAQQDPRADRRRAPAGLGEHDRHRPARGGGRRRGGRATTAWCWRRAASSCSPRVCPAPSGSSTSTPWTGPGGSPTICATGRTSPPWSSAPGSSAWRPRPHWPTGAGCCWWTGRDVVGHQLGPGPREEIESALDELGIETRLGDDGDGGRRRVRRPLRRLQGRGGRGGLVAWGCGPASSPGRSPTSSTTSAGCRWTSGCAPFPRCSSPGDTAAAAFDADAHGHAGLPARHPARQGRRVQRGGRPARRTAARLHARPVRHLPGPGRRRCASSPGAGTAG